MGMLAEEIMGVGFSDAPRGSFGPGGGGWPRHWGESPSDAEKREAWIFANARRDHRRRLSPAQQLALVMLDSLIRRQNYARLAELDVIKDGP